MAGAGGRSAGSPGRRRAQRILVVSQLAASFMLLIGAGLLTRTLMQLYAVDPGFDLANVLSLQAPDFTAQSRDKRLQFSQDVLDRVEEPVDVQSSAMASSAPLAGAMAMPQEIQVDGGDPDAAAAQIVVSRVISTGYFATVGTELIDRARVPADRYRDGAAGGDPQPGDGAVLLQGPEPDRPATELEAGQRQLVAAGGNCRRRRRHARGRPDGEAEDDAVSARHADVRGLDAARAHGRLDRTTDAARRRNDPRARSQSPGRSRADARGNP